MVVGGLSLAGFSTVSGDQPVVYDFSGSDADSLQRMLLLHSGEFCRVRLRPGATIMCPVREDRIGGEKSPHALLIPEKVRLDLNGSTLLLDLRSNSYGIRLTNHAAISGGTVRVVHSEGKGSQGCWHSAISVGAAYGDGGTPEKPGYFTSVSHWAIEDMVIDQQVEASAIQLMSEACHGVIRNITISDSDVALLGIGMDWGSVGPITSEDRMIPQMQTLWHQKQIYSTHPHDILIQNIRIGRLGRNQDANDAGIRCSACHRITIQNVAVKSAAAAIAVWGGDCGYEFARAEQRAAAHSGYVIENVSIDAAHRFGLVLNGSADNILRAARDYGYQPLLDPVHPGIFRPVIRNLRLLGTGQGPAQGVYAVSVSDAACEHLDVRQFDIGIHVEDWVRGMRFEHCSITDNTRNVLVEGATEPATGVTFDLPVR